MEFVVYVGGMSNEGDLNVSVERPTRFYSFLLLVLLNRQLANGVTSRRQMRTRELILTISFCFLFFFFRRIRLALDD